MQYEMCASIHADGRKYRNIGDDYGEIGFNSLRNWEVYCSFQTERIPIAGGQRADGAVCSLNASSEIIIANYAVSVLSE